MMMPIKYDPKEFLKKIAPTQKVEKLVTQKLTLNKTVLTVLEGGADFISKSSLQRTALKVIKQYREKYQELKEDDVPFSEAKDEAVNENKLLVSRVQNNVVNQIAGEIKDKYRGEYYIWLPSDADEPDPLHQLNYGKRFQIGKGEMPGDRDGCRCGMKILVDDDELEL